MLHKHNFLGNLLAVAFFRHAAGSVQTKYCSPVVRVLLSNTVGLLDSISGSTNNSLHSLALDSS